MGTKNESDEVIRRLTGEFRVLTLGGLAVIVTGFSRNTYNADIWVEPFASPDEWSNRLGPMLYSAGTAQPVALGSWDNIGPENLAGVIGRDGVIRLNGLERPLDIFRAPNQLPMEDFDEIWDRAQPLDDGTRLPDAIDLLVSKQETGRDKDRADIIFLESKIEADYLERLPRVSAGEAARMLGRFLTPRVAEAALSHPAQDVGQLARRFLHDLAEEGDPYAAEILRRA